MLNKIVYITYQTFPADTANSLQTISNIKYFIKNKIKVDLFFPLRSVESTDEIETLHKFYDFTENFNCVGVKHPYPHGKVRFFKAISFHISHFLWAKAITGDLINVYDENTQFFTRSDWVAYFLARKDLKVVFECHQTSKVRNYVIKKIKFYENVKLIFLNDNLSKFYKHPKNSLIAHNGVDSEIFSSSKIAKIQNSIIFVGNLSRFNKSRGLESIIKYFSSIGLNRTFSLDVVGGPEEQAKKLKKIVDENNLNGSIKVHGRLNRKETIEIIQKSSFGLLVNSQENSHSYNFTSPLKYFEYLYGNLNVIAVDFPSHRALPYANKISFYDLDDEKSFFNALNNAQNTKPLNINELSSITLEARTKNILKFLN